MLLASMLKNGKIVVWQIMCTSRVPVESKSPVCVICMKYRIILLIIIIISLGQIILSYMANTSRTHACIYARTHTHTRAHTRAHTHVHTRAHAHARPPTAVTIKVVAVRWVGVRPTMTKTYALFLPVPLAMIGRSVLHSNKQSRMLCGMPSR